MKTKAKLGSIATALLLAWLTLGNLFAQERPQPLPPPPQEPERTGARVRVSTEIVLVNVVARDKHGNVIKDLKREDFT
ncbi:MAG: hypothetical protein WBQ89_22725, partial [Candidatus Acidiferrum sp.]